MNDKEIFILNTIKGLQKMKTEIETLDSIKSPTMQAYYLGYNAAVEAITGRFEEMLPRYVMEIKPNDKEIKIIPDKSVYIMDDIQKSKQGHLWQK